MAENKNEGLKSIKIILNNTGDRKTLAWKIEYDGRLYGDYFRLSEDEEEIKTNEAFVDTVNLLLGQAVGCIEAVREGRLL